MTPEKANQGRAETQRKRDGARNIRSGISFLERKRKKLTGRLK